MITTYRKMATLAVAIGQPSTSSKYLEIAHQLLEKYQNSGDNKIEKTPEQIKEQKENRANLLF
jgi:hypothetical protein